MESGFPSDPAIKQNALAPPPDLPAVVRVDARLMLRVSGADGMTRIAERREEGAFRFRFPRSHDRKGNGREAMLVNVAGGLAGGDRVSLETEASAGAMLTLSSAAAERVYRSVAADTRIDLALSAKTGASLVWLPQETILHDGARLVRQVTIDCDRQSTLLFGEMLYFGRAARDEAFTFGRLKESWRVRSEGRLILADETSLAGSFGEALARPAARGKASAMASLMLLGADAGERLAPIRDALVAHKDVEAGASDLGGLVFVRLLAEDGASLRAAFLAAAHAACLATMRLPRTLTL